MEFKELPAAIDPAVAALHEGKTVVLLAYRESEFAGIDNLCVSDGSVRFQSRKELTEARFFLHSISDPIEDIYRDRFDAQFTKDVKDKLLRDQCAAMPAISCIMVWIAN